MGVVVISGGGDVGNGAGFVPDLGGPRRGKQRAVVRVVNGSVLGVVELAEVQEGAAVGGIDPDVFPQGRSPCFDEPGEACP